jgi:hypothetical protein
VAEGISAGVSSDLIVQTPIKPDSKKSRGLAWKEIKQQINGELDSKGQGSVLHLGNIKELK